MINFTRISIVSPVITGDRQNRDQGFIAVTLGDETTLIVTPDELDALVLGLQAIRSDWHGA